MGPTEKTIVSMCERTVSELTTELDKALHLTKSLCPFKKSESAVGVKAAKP